MNTQELERHIRFEEKISSYLSSYTNSDFNIPYRFWYIPIFFRLIFEEPLSFVAKESRIRIKRFIKYLPAKDTVGILVNGLNKGGVEQVIYNLCHNFKNFEPIIFITGSEYGNTGFKLLTEGFAVYILNDDFEKFKEIVRDRKIKLINAHFSTWNFERIHHLNLPIVYVIHNMYTWLDVADIQNRKKSYKHVNAFIAVSSQVKDYFSKKFEISRQKIAIIENGFDSRTTPMPDIGIKRKNPYLKILNVASYTPLKNQILLIQSFSEVYKTNKDARLILAGNILDGEYFDAMKKMIDSLKLNKVIKLTGFLEKDKLSELYMRSNILVLSSLQEGAPNVLLEGLYYQIPIISTNVGNASKLLYNRGIVVSNPYRDLYKTSISKLVSYAYHPKRSRVEELAKAIEKMTNDYRYYEKINATSRLFIKQNYSLSNTAAEYEEVFSRIL